MKLLSKIIFTLFIISTISCENIGYDAIQQVEDNPYIAGPLIFYFKFDSTDNYVAIDSSGNNLHGEIKGISIVNGMVDDAYEFDGVFRSEVSLGLYEFSIKNQITVVTWIKLNTTVSSYGRIVGLNHSWQVMRENNKIKFINDFTANSGQFFSESSQTLIESNATLSVGQWYHLAITFSGYETKLFLNGVLDNEDRVTTTISHHNLLATWETIDVGDSAYDGNFDGALDELYIYNTVRTADEIAAHYNETNEGN